MHHRTGPFLHVRFTLNLPARFSPLIHHRTGPFPHSNTFGGEGAREALALTPLPGFEPVLSLGALQGYLTSKKREPLRTP